MPIDVMRARLVAIIAALVVVIAIFAIPTGAATPPSWSHGHKKPTPTPTATSASPTPIPTPSATSPTATSTACTNPTAIPEGVSKSYFDAAGGEYQIHNNNWNDTAGGTTTIYDCN